MKATELMIGDWLCNNNITIGQKEFQVYPYFIPQCKDNELENLNIKPIPLTAEILKLNGWKIGMYSILNIEDGMWLEYYHHERRLRKWWKGIDEWQKAEVKEITFQCQCKYIHEFQHALRLCGLNELADNWRIQQ